MTPFFVIAPGIMIQSYPNPAVPLEPWLQHAPVFCCLVMPLDPLAPRMTSEVESAFQQIWHFPISRLESKQSPIFSKSQIRYILNFLPKAYDLVLVCQMNIIVKVEGLECSLR